MWGFEHLSHCKDVCDTWAATLLLIKRTWSSSHTVASVDLWCCTVDLCTNIPLIDGEIQQHDITRSFFGLCAICAHNTHLSDRDMKQDHKKNDLSGHNLKMKRPFSPSPFHTAAYVSPWESTFTQWAHYRLFTSVFCIWGVDKPVVVTHRPTHNAHNAATAGSWCRGFDAVMQRLTWSFISCTTWFTPTPDL